jgi:N-acetylmuramic acid 6-phosphate (MurNAc-6-P) etherase
VEIPCTYGLPKDRVLVVIAGGTADAAMEIEDNFEEDVSSVPEMLLLHIDTKDLVIGISASGSAWFVQSALALAKSRGAYRVLIRAAASEHSLPFCDREIPLHSGWEVVAGSTRMKAGTATKKALNFITTAATIRLGKVKGSYMIDVACINQKLVNRAIHILQTLYRVEEPASLELLERHRYDLGKAIRELDPLPPSGIFLS